ncbi:hypothetical protein COCOBI_18-2990 [Coccomyxa sp. Obi]|nr:hypothetical protein COCOBI_18-2990 [Coccomyxa sp. Obi]
MHAVSDQHGRHSPARSRRTLRCSPLGPDLFARLGRAGCRCPVQLTAGCLAHCQHTAGIIHGLPYEYKHGGDGLTQTLLDLCRLRRDHLRVSSLRSPRTLGSLEARREEDLSATSRNIALQRALSGQYYGEQSTFLGSTTAPRASESRTENQGPSGQGGAQTALQCSSTPQPGETRQHLAARLFYSGDSATGLFAARPVSIPTQAELLEALRQVAYPGGRLLTAEGSSGDGAFPSQSWKQPSGACHAAKAPGRMAYLTSSTSASGHLSVGSLTAVLQDAFTSPASPSSASNPMLTGPHHSPVQGEGRRQGASQPATDPSRLLKHGLQAGGTDGGQQTWNMSSTRWWDPTAEQASCPSAGWGNNVARTHLEEIQLPQGHSAARCSLSSSNFEEDLLNAPRQSNGFEQCMAQVGLEHGAQRWVRITAHRPHHRTRVASKNRLAINDPGGGAFTGQLRSFPGQSPLAAALVPPHSRWQRTARRRAQHASDQDRALSDFRLSLLGRALCWPNSCSPSMVTYHATLHPSAQSAGEAPVHSHCHTFVGRGYGTSARLLSWKDTSSTREGRAHRPGGPQSPDPGPTGQSGERLLEPEQLAWKSFFDFWLYRRTAWQTAQEPSPAAHHQHIWQLGRFLPFSAFDAQRMQAPLRVRQYVYAYQKPQPHRLRQPDSLEYHEVMSEPLFFNRQVRDATGQPIAWRLGPDRAWSGSAIFAPLCTAHHYLSLHFSQIFSCCSPHCPNSGECLSTAHRLLHSGSPLRVQPIAGHSTPRTQEEQQDQGEPPAQSQEDQPAQHQPAPPYLFGFWGTHMVNPTSWGLGKRPAHQYVVKEATQRRQVLHRLKHGHPQSPVRPAIWADSNR